MIDTLLSGNYLRARGKRFFLVSTVLLSLIVLLSLFVGWRFGDRGMLIGAGLISLLLMALAILYREDELAAVLCIAVHLYDDWYLGMRVLALGFFLILLLVRYLTRSSQQVWTFPRLRGLWLLLFLLAIAPALRGYTLADGMTYYLTIFVAPLLAFWLGALLAQNTLQMKRLFQMFAGFGALLAILSLIQAATGKLLFSSSHFAQYLAQVSDFQLTGSSIHRTGIFFINPDSSGTFFAMVVFLSLCLFFESSEIRARILYFSEALLMVLALLSSYSTGAWAASSIALLIFLVLLGKRRSRLFLLGLLAFIAAVLLIFFRVQLLQQMQHIAAVGDLKERFVAWQIAIRIIKALPLTGLGLGTYAYFYRAPAFRLPHQFYNPLAHPHNAYLEVAAMGGLPLGVVFLLLLLLSICWAVRNWTRTEGQTRMLLAGGIAAVVTLSVNSLGVNSWTLAPLAAAGWLILGMISSPLILQKRRLQAEHLPGDENDGGGNSPKANANNNAGKQNSGKAATVNARLLSRPFWNMFPFPGFFKAEWRLWRQQQSQPRYRFVADFRQVASLPFYPLDMSALLALPHGSLDQHGVPCNHQTGYYPAVYQPTTIAQYALAQWNTYLATRNTACKEAFLTQAEWLIAHEQRSDDDAGRWPIPFPAYGYTTQESWLSALTQGNVISVLTRAYQLTGDERFLQVARRAVRTFQYDIHAGGVSTSPGKDGLFFEEIAVYPAAHILNGYFFALFGLYDYSAITHDVGVDECIKRSLVTFHALINNFDTGYWSRYDLYFKNLATPFYHSLHVAQLQALSSYSGCQHCAELAERWSTYTYRPTYFILTRMNTYRHAFKRRFARLFSARTNRSQRGLLKHA